MIELVYNLAGYACRHADDVAEMTFLSWKNGILHSDFQHLATFCTRILGCSRSSIIPRTIDATKVAGYWTVLRRERRVGKPGGRP